MAGKKSEQGLTLIELMVVVAVLGILAAVTVPAFSRDREEGRFRDYIKRFIGDLTRVKAEAISKREDRSIIIAGASHQIESVVGGVNTLIVKRTIPDGVFIGGVTASPAVPWNGSYSPPTYSAAMSGTVELRFNDLGQMQVDTGGGLTSSSASVFFRTNNGQHRARVVIFPTTSFTKYYEGW